MPVMLAVSGKLNAANIYIKFWKIYLLYIKIRCILNKYHDSDEKIIYRQS